MQKYPEIKKLEVLIMLELIPLKGWLVCFGSTGSLRTSIYIEPRPDRERKKEKKENKQYIDLGQSQPKMGQTTSIPHLLQAQMALARLLHVLTCYCGSARMCRWNGNCVDINTINPKTYLGS